MKYAALPLGIAILAASVVAAATRPTQTEPPPGLAEGGKAKKGKPYIVGEKGPELFVPDESGTVVPQAQFFMERPPLDPKTREGIFPPGNNRYGTWPKAPTPDWPGRYAGVGREIRRQSREVQIPYESLLDLMQRAPLRINPAAWERFLSEQAPITHVEDRRQYDPTMQPPGSYPY